METKLERIARVSKEKPNEKITSLAGIINEETLKESHRKMCGKKAVGVDQMTKDDYKENLDGNIESLVSSMKRQAYKPQPVRRVYTLKPVPIKCALWGFLHTKISWFKMIYVTY